MAGSQESMPAGTARDETAPFFRCAKPEEDGMLSRILCNAFLPLWNHNWFHGVSQSLEPVPVSTINSTPAMTKLQKSRVRFYHALISVTRLVGGSIIVADVAAAADNNDSNNSTMTRDIGAILLWLPPEKRLSALNILTLYNSGFLTLMLPWHYGLRGLHRVLLVFEENIHKMWSRTLPDLPPHGFKESDCGFVQMLAANSKYAGKGYASALLDYQVQQHFAEFPDRPVILDTTTLQGVRAYERLGFKLLAETAVETGTDARGIKLKDDASEEVKREGREACVQSIMVKLPGGIS